MTATEQGPPVDATTKRNVAVLVTAQAFLGAQMPIHFTVGGLAGQQLASNICFATLPISMTVIGSMLTAPVMSGTMQRYGRRTGFVLGTMGGALGSALCAYALFIASFPLLLIGSLFIGVYMSSQGFLRFAAADTATGSFRPKAISYVMAGGLLAAIFGPQLGKYANELIVIPFAGAYLAMVFLNLFGSFIFAGLRIPRPKPREEGAAVRTRLELLKDRRILTAMVCAMVAYALMNLVMTATPLAIVGCGFAEDHAFNVVSAHVIAMFAPSFFTGHLIARFGAEKIIAAGLTILFAAGTIALSGVELANFFGALILLGIGWNFGFIGATSMLTDKQKPQEQGRIQGMNDFAVFGLVAIASVTSGGLMNCSGGEAVQGWMAVNLAMAPFLLVAGAMLTLYVLGGKRRPT